MKILSAVVAPNPKKQRAVKLKSEVESFLKRHGVDVKRGGDVLVTIGGDGTMLYNKKKCNQPIFGIGSDKSAICQSNFRNWRGVLLRVLRRNRIEWRSMLQCRISGRAYEDALNEICVLSRNHRVIGIRLSFLGKRKVFRADGLLFSTPTGSTAYAYSAGAPKLPPHATKYEIVPVNSYMREFKTVVVPDSTECEVKVLAGNADLVIDGQFIHHLKLNSAVKVRKSSRKLGLIQPA